MIHRQDDDATTTAVEVPSVFALTRSMNSQSALAQRSFGETRRIDVWWLQPLLVFLGLGTFIVYSTWAAFQGVHYYFGNYVSPFYSPELFGDSPHSWFGPKPRWWPG